MSHRFRPGRVGLAASLALFATVALSSEVDVVLHDGRIDLRATEAPLADVLGRVTQAIGAEVEYKGPPPEQVVTVTLLDQTPADALVGLLVDQGTDFALQTDAAGTGVVKVVIATDTAVDEKDRPAPSASRRREPEEPVGPQALQRLLDRLGVVPEQLEAAAAQVEGDEGP